MGLNFEKAVMQMEVLQVVTVPAFFEKYKSIKAACLCAPSYPLWSSFHNGSQKATRKRYSTASFRGVVGGVGFAMVSFRHGNARHMRYMQVVIL